jgi:uncharacterized protein (TIGR00369 family)
VAKSFEAPGAAVARWWDRLSKLPGGKTMFSLVIGRTAPYTGSIGARVVELRPGYARWTMKDRHSLRNHLNSIHAVALVNLAEVTSGTAMLMSLPASVRGIVVEISTTYMKKARGTLTAECTCELPVVIGETRFDVHAEIRDRTEDVVATATVTWLLSPRT